MKTQVAVVGSGPGGASHALFLARKGIHSVLVEKEQFPRYHIGESLIGEVGAMLNTLGFGDEMEQKKFPVKRGVSVYGPSGTNAFFVPVMKREEDGLRDTFTWQVRRSDFDDMLHRKCQESEFVTTIKGKALKPIMDGDAVKGLRVQLDDGTKEDIESEMLVDASGMATWLSNAGVTSKKERGQYDKQLAVFSQVKNAIRDEGQMQDNTLIFYRDRCHWIWFIPLDDQSVSVGVVCPSDYFKGKGESKHDFLMRELREHNPELSRRLPEIDLTEEVRAVSNYSYRIKNFTGKGYLCIGDAHGFIDPVFSFGLYVSMKEAQQAADEIEAYLGGAYHDLDNPFAAFERRCNHAQSIYQDLIDTFWDHPMAFAYFVHSRYPEDCIDLFAGRIFDDQDYPVFNAFRKVIAAGRGNTTSTGDRVDAA